MRRRSLQLDGEEIPNYCELRPSTDNAAANNYYNGHIHPGREEEVPAVVQRRQRRVTMSVAATPSQSLPPPLQMAPIAITRGGFGVFVSPPHRPLAVRTILSISSVILLLIVIGDVCFSANKINKYTTDDINELTQTVLRLSQELHDAQIDNERTHHELELVEKDLSDNKIELNWETHHVRSIEESHRLMKESMLDQIHKDQINIIDTTKAASDIAARQKQEHEVQLTREHDENIQLRVALAKSIEELDRVRRIQKQQQQQQLNAPIELENEADRSRSERNEMSGNKTSNTKSYERLLRGGSSNYQPGDGIEIIERIRRDDGVTKIALRPGEL